MSRNISINCNRCGTEIPSFQTKEKSALIKLWSPGEYRTSGGQRIDLCETCHQKFVNFLESEVEADD